MGTTSSSPPPAALRTADGLSLPARWWPAEGPGAAVVLAHGFTATKESAPLAAAAEELAAGGHGVLSYDARGHGAAEGRCTLGDREQLDVAAAVDAVAARWPGRAVVLVGASMGAIAVLRHAATDDPRIRGVVAVSSPARWELPRTWRGVLAAGLTRTAPGRLLTARHMGTRVDPRWRAVDEPVALARRLTLPLAVVHGAEDRFVPPRAARELAAAAAGSCDLQIVPGMGHGYDAATPPVICRAVAWVLAAATR